MNSQPENPDPNATPANQQATPANQQATPANQAQDSIEIQGKSYHRASEAELATLLQQTKPIEHCYIESLVFGPQNQGKHRLIFKDCVIGKIAWTGAAFEQPLQFENTRFEKEIAIQDDIVIKDLLLFSACIFEKSVIIRNAQISGMSTLNSTFEQILTIEASEFFDESNFSRTVFEKKLTIKNSIFHRQLRLQNSQLKAEAAILGCTLHGDLKLESAQLFASAQFKETTIMGELRMDTATTHARVDFEKIECHENARWNNGLFNDKLVVRACHFFKFATWCNCLFKDHFALPSSRFDGEVALDGTVFEEKVFFQDTNMDSLCIRGTTFHKYWDCERLHIRGQMLCQGSTFEEPVSFSFMETEGHGRISFNAVFKAPVDFYRATLRGPVWFLGTQFQDVSFVNTTFDGQVFFSFDPNTLRERNRRRKEGPREQALTFVVRFGGTANFTNTLFYRKAVFENVFFERFANFENAHFAEEITFENAHFKEGATFKGIFCTQEMDFTKAVFDKYVNFDLANINRRLNLTDAAIDQGISFYHAVIDVVVAERDQIEGRLIYEGTIQGQEFKKHYMRVKEEYLILKESFHQRGKFDEEDWAYHCYRVNDRKSLTDKAWRSMLKKPILAIQDDVPEEEREDDQLLIQQAQKALEKIQKSIESYQSRIQKMQEQKATYDDPSKAKNMEDRIADIQEKIVEQQSLLIIRQAELEETTKIVQMNAERLSKLHESRDKPFGRPKAFNQLVQNAFWKLVDWGTGYGVKPFRIMFLALAVILGFAAIYACSNVPFPYPDQSLVPSSSIQKFMDWVYFSAMTFATASLEGDISYHPSIKFFIMSEALVGLFLTALFVGCYTRKILR